MKRLETSDWLVLNNIIYKIHTTKDLTAMRKEFLEQLKMLLDFDGADFYLAEMDDDELRDLVTYNCNADRSIKVQDLDYGKGIVAGGKSMVYRDTDIIDDQKRITMEYYQKVYRPNNWNYSVQMILENEQKLVGVVTLYRTIGKDNFLYDDIFLLDLLKEHLAYRLMKDLKCRQQNKDKFSVDEAAVRFELTKREETILALLVAGEENEEICSELVISVNTLKKHVLNIYRKLGIRNRVQMFKMII